MHPHVFTQTPLAGDAVEIVDQQHADHQFGIHRRPARLAVKRTQPVTQKSEIHVAVDQAQQVSPGDVIFQLEVVE